MTMRFRSLPLTGDASTPSKIDYKAGVIRGVSLMQAVEALGHNMLVDATTLQQVASAVNATDGGMKSRFTHPGMCEDGIGKQLGRVKNASVVGDKVLGDLHLSQSAKMSPSGDLYSYVLELAKDSPQDFGMSIVFEPLLAFKMADGSEQAPKFDTSDPFAGPVMIIPAGATTEKPFARVKKLCAVDLVGEPAANRDGLFSDTSSAIGERAFADIDSYLAANGIPLDRAFSLVTRYFQARGLSLKPTTGDRPVQKGDVMDPKVLKALKGEHPDHAGLIVDMFADGKSESEIRSAIKEANVALLSKKTVELLGTIDKERTDHKAGLQAKDDQIAKLQKDLDDANKIAALGRGAPKDPGSLEQDPSESDGGAAALEKRWKEDPKLRETFLGDKSVFLALASVSDKPISVSSDGRVGARSFAPKGQGNTVTRIKHDDILKHGEE